MSASDFADPADDRSNVRVQPAPTSETHLLSLMDRRAALLGSAVPGAPTTELRDVTLELTDRLSTASPRIRRVRADEPGDLLERLVAGEPVHPFAPDDSSADLADRLAEDRRCFVLEHPLLPGHPMNVVWVALRDGPASRITEVLDPAAPTSDPRTADTAVFYSIWNVEPGLVGIPGGTSLLSAAMDALRDEFPHLAQFVTLSPIPGFRDWATLHHVGPLSGPDVLQQCATYLTTLDRDGRPIDAVARFHLGNGARLVRLVDDADPSERGQRRSWGVMASYRYAPEDLGRNRDDLASGRPAVSDDVRRLLTAAAC